MCIKCSNKDLGFITKDNFKVTQTSKKVLCDTNNEAKVKSSSALANLVTDYVPAFGCYTMIVGTDSLK